MPVVAADIFEAITLTTERVALENRTAGQVYSQLVLFIDGVEAIGLDLSNEGNRTVRNWLIQARLIQAELANFGAPFATIGPAQRQEVVDIAGRIMYAADVAVGFGNITAPQRAAVLAAWNASFGLLP